MTRRRMFKYVEDSNRLHNAEIGQKDNFYSLLAVRMTDFATAIGE